MTILMYEQANAAHLRPGRSADCITVSPQLIIDGPSQHIPRERRLHPQSSSFVEPPNRNRHEHYAKESQQGTSPLETQPLVHLALEGR